MSIIDFTYIKKEQQNFLEHLKSIEGIKYQEDEFNVPMWLTLAILSELIEVLNETKIHKWWDVTPPNMDRVKEELVDMLAHLGNLANILDVDMVVNAEEIQEVSLERQFINMAYRITTLPWRKLFGKNKLEILLTQYVQLVYSLGFDIEEIKEAYYIKLDVNYTRF